MHINTEGISDTDGLIEAGHTFAIAPVVDGAAVNAKEPGEV